METKEPKINYLCDGEVENCKKKTCYKTNCYKGENANEIVCKYTKDIRHAKNFLLLSHPCCFTSCHL